MHLVSSLASGIRGAENGQASFFLRGTSTPVTVYRDFEGQDPVSVGNAVTLDANGGVEIYVDVMTSVEVKGSDGSVVREFVAGYSSPGVEVRSQAFTGQAYDDGSGRTVKGIGQPTTAQSVLDRWREVNGGPDWKVPNAAGDFLSIPDAFASISGLFINPKASEYGAIGDGSNNDLPALEAATAAAALVNGSIVLPRGTYRIVDTWNIPHNVDVLGLGGNAIVILLDNASDADVISIAAPADPVAIQQTLSGFHIAAAQATDGVAIKVDEPGLAIRDITIGFSTENTRGSAVEMTGGATSHVLMENVIIRENLDAGSPAVPVVSHGAGYTGYLQAENCTIIFGSMASNRNGMMVYNGSVQGCIFDMSAVDNFGQVEGVKPVPGGHVTIMGSHFIGSDVVGIVANTAAVRTFGGIGIVNEFGNTVTGNFLNGPIDFSSAVDRTKVNMASMRRALRPYDSGHETSAAVTILDADEYDYYYVNRTVTTNFPLGIASTAAIEGHFFSVLVENSAGGNINQVTPEGSSDNVSIPNGKKKLFVFMGSTDGAAIPGWRLIGEPFESD